MDNIKIEKLESINDYPNPNSPPVLGVFSGIFAKVDHASQNNRYYSKEFWTKVINSDKVREDLRKGRMMGTFEHPNVMEVFDSSGHATAKNPQNTAFITKELWINGDSLMGRGYIINSPLGNLLANYLQAKDHNGNPLVELGISARGYSREDGPKDRLGREIMDPNDYYLQAFDIVLHPGFQQTKIKLESADSELSNYIEKLESAIKITCDYYNIRNTIISELNLKSSIFN